MLGNSKNLGTTIGTVVSRLLFRKTPISPLLENIYIRIGNKSKANNCKQNIQQNYLIEQNITFLLKGRALKLCITSHPSCFEVSIILGLNKTKVTLKLALLFLSNAIWEFPCFISKSKWKPSHSYLLHSLFPFPATVEVPGFSNPWNGRTLNFRNHNTGQSPTRSKKMYINHVYH